MKKLIFTALVLTAIVSQGAESPSRVQGMWGSGNKLVVRYEFKLVFYELPKNVALKARRGTDFQIIRTSSSGEKEVSLKTLTPRKTITFTHPIDIEPAWPRITETNILVCTRQMFDPPNKQGELDDFCGIISVNGEIVYRFKLHQTPPHVIASASGIARDGKQALIVVGEGAYSDEDGVTPWVSKVKKTIVWDFPDKETVSDVKLEAESNLDHWRARYTNDWPYEQRR